MSEHTLHIATLGCSRNEVDSEELAGRLAQGGFRLVASPEEAETIVVNTCGFIEAAKKDSIDTLLEAASLKESGKAASVVAVGCMAERYGKELAKALPEADGVLGFDSYTDMADRLRAILAGERIASHEPKDRRKLLPLSPIERPGVGLETPGHNLVIDETVVRQRLESGPSAPLKIASGCDRRCAFCAIPSFRGAYLSRPAEHIVAEARWLAEQGVKELFLVSENTSSYGKDFGETMALVDLLHQLNDVDGIEWIRVSYMQPAEIRPGMIETIVDLDKVVNYFDLSFQHASKQVLRKMRRFGDPDSFLGLINRIRSLDPEAGIRSNVITGFPGETEEDVAILAQFVEEARLDVLGVFGYSDEEGTEGATLDGHLDSDEIEARRQEISDLAQEIADQRASDRIGTDVVVLVETEDGTGRAHHQAPEVDGATSLTEGVKIGSLVKARVIDADGVDLVARPL